MLGAVRWQHMLNIIVLRGTVRSVVLYVPWYCTLRGTVRSLVLYVPWYCTFRGTVRSVVGLSRERDRETESE